LTRDPKKVHVLHPTRLSSFTDVTTHRDENNHYHLTISTMVDSGPPGAGNLPLNICVQSPHQDGLNDTMEVMEEAELMDYDSIEGGGFVTVSPMHHFTLFHLLSGLDKDVYYVVDANYSKSSDSSQPSLVMAIKEKFPDIDPASFVAAFKRASYKKMFSKGKHESFLLTSVL
jgi:hypothetical protein